MTAHFSITYGGPISYYAALVRCREVIFSPHEPWQKQSYRNRCYIDAPNGKLMLNIPIDHNKSDGTIGNTFVSTDENWRSKHWQAYKTTYNLSPFFDELAPEFKEVLFESGDNLFMLNLALTQMVLRWMCVDLSIKILDARLEMLEDSKLLTSNSKLPTKDSILWTNDYTTSFHPKTETPPNTPPYPQVFAHKHGFLSNLSIFDLCFNEGPAAFDYLSTL